jgi:hypothetical protein
MKAMPSLIESAMSVYDMPPLALNQFRELCKSAARKQYRDSLALAKK